MKSFLILLFSISIGTFGVQADEPHFLTDPAPSPDGQHIIFCFEGDLWQMERASGDAYRLTAMSGYESDPVFSPDGKWLAFTGTQYGNPDVFLIPASGGDIKQMTFHDAADHMENWSWDSQEMLIRSSRENSSSVYRVPVSGGQPVRMFDHYFNVVHNVAIHPITGEIFFNDTWESLSMANRKRYVGQYDPDIQSYNPDAKKFKTYTDWEGKDMWVTIDQQGVVYFVSDQHTGQYNLFTLENGQPKQLTQYKSSIYHPHVSVNGDIVVFEKDYKIWVYDTKTEQVSQQAVHIVRNTLLPAEQPYNVSGKISSFDVSGDQKKIAFVSRGALFVSDIKGKFVRELNTGDDFERVQEVKWLKDNETLIFSMTWKGYSNWYTLAADGTGSIKQITQEERNNRNLVMDLKREKAAYLSGRDELRILDLEKMKTNETIRDEFWGSQSGEIDFSPDGKWLMYGAKRDFENDVFVVNLEDMKPINLTQTGVSENGAKWGPDGKYIYLVTNRLRPSYPRGSGGVHIFKVALDKFAGDIRSEQFDELFNKDTTKTKAKEIDPIKINTDKIWERYSRIGPSFGSQGLQGLLKTKNKTILLFSSNHDKGKTGLWKYETEPFEKTKTEAISGLPGRAEVLIVKDKVYALAGGSIYTLNLSAKKASKVEIKHGFERSMQDEFVQIFNQTWANIEENFYHDKMHNEDWEAHRSYYAQFIPYLNNREDFRLMMNHMLGELNSSHMGFSSRGPEEKGLLSYTTLECGLAFPDLDPYRVDRVIPRGPADQSGIDILPGDRLVKVDGEAVNQSFPRDYYFYRPARAEEVTLTFERAQKEFEVVLKPVSSRAVPGYFYAEWIDENRAQVDEWSDHSIAYAHMKNMGTGELNDFIMTMTRELPDKQGLILDLRYNTGGNVHDEVLRFLQQKTYLHWKARGGKLANQSNFAPSDHPIVLLINEQSLSDAEMTAAGFKELGLGKIVGTETYRWIIFTSGMGLVDGSFHRLPGWGCYTLDGDNLERTGVAPDIFVKQTFVDRLNGEDPQLKRAVEEILNNQ